MYPKIENRPWKVLKSENILRLGPWRDAATGSTT